MGDSWSNREVSGIQAILVVAALVIVGLGFVVSVMLINDYSRDHWVPAAIWVRLALFSTITLAAMIVEFKRRWKRVRFWFALAGLMLARTAIYVAVLKQAPDWPLLGFAFVTFVKIRFLAALLGRFGRRTHGVHA